MQYTSFVLGVMFATLLAWAGLGKIFKVGTGLSSGVEAGKVLVVGLIVISLTNPQFGIAHGMFEGNIVAVCALVLVLGLFLGDSAKNVLDAREVQYAIGMSLLFSFIAENTTVGADLAGTLAKFLELVFGLIP